MSMTLEQAQWAIAEKLEAYRLECPCAKLYREDSPFKDIQNCGYAGPCESAGKHTDKCLLCHGKGYLPREPWELADILHQQGYASYINREFDMSSTLMPPYVIVHIFGKWNNPVSKSVRRKDKGTDPYLTLHLAALEALGIEAKDE